MTRQERSWRQQGAQAERDVWIAKVRRMMRDETDGTDLLKWGLSRKKRYNRRKGGLGK